MPQKTTDHSSSKGDSAWGFIPVGSISARGWWAEQLQTDLFGFAGRLDELCSEVGSNFFASGRVVGGHWRHLWNGESEGKWIDGLTRMAHVSHNPVARARVAAYV